MHAPASTLAREFCVRVRVRVRVNGCVAPGWEMLAYFPCLCADVFHKFRFRYVLKAFAGICNPKQCVCEVIENGAMGRELGAMCKGGSSHANSTAVKKYPSLPPLPSPPPPPPPSSSSSSSASTSSSTSSSLSSKGNYWDCAAAVFDQCSGSLVGPSLTPATSPASCERCAANLVSSNICTKAELALACTPDQDFCSAGVEYACGKSDKTPGPSGKVDLHGCTMHVCVALHADFLFFNSN